MTELSFNAVILSKISPARGGEQETADLQWARELFYDSGVEDVSILTSLNIPFQGGSRLPVNPPPETGNLVLEAAQSFKGTHLLVLDGGFTRMEPIIFIRLMQMSCLGMGVLPFVHGVCQPLAACYPVSIRTLKDFATQNASSAEALAMAALRKGLVARYNVPAKDARSFCRSSAILAA